MRSHLGVFGLWMNENGLREGAAVLSSVPPGKVLGVQKEHGARIGAGR
jgi:hypothetical protein